jgi:hypothetical protein
MSVNRFGIRWVALAAAAVVGAIAAPAQAAPTRTYGYEYGFGGWVVGYAGEGRSTVHRTTDVAYAGRYSVACHLDGTTGPATVWLAHRYPAPLDTVLTVAVTFHLRSAQASDVNVWPVVAYVGTRPPTGAADFTTVGHTDQVAGWQRYRFERLQLTGQAPAQVWVALGISAGWEYSREYHLDQVAVSVNP